MATLQGGLCLGSFSGPRSILLGVLGWVSVAVQKLFRGVGVGSTGVPQGRQTTTAVGEQDCPSWGAGNLSLAASYTSKSDEWNLAWFLGEGAFGAFNYNSRLGLAHESGSYG